MLPSSRTNSVVIASDSEAIQTLGLRLRLSLDRFALLAMTVELRQPKDNLLWSLLRLDQPSLQPPGFFAPCAAA